MLSAEVNLILNWLIRSYVHDLFEFLSRKKLHLKSILNWLVAFCFGLALLRTVIASTRAAFLYSEIQVYFWLRYKYFVILIFLMIKRWCNLEINICAANWERETCKTLYSILKKKATSALARHSAHKITLWKQVHWGLMDRHQSTSQCSSFKKYD